MKCDCHETDLAFNLCVEGVEDIQLGDIIQHMGWRKTDDKFILSYPLRVFSDQYEKELVSSNFCRVGQELFGALLSGIDWELPLERLAQKFFENGIEWYIVGSTGDALHGVNVNPFDIDIVVNTKDYYKAKKICYLNFPGSVIAPLTGSQEISPSKYFDNPLKYFINPMNYFGRLFIAGALVEVSADEVWNLESRQGAHKNSIWNGYEQAAYERMDWHGYTIYVESLQHRHQIEIARNRKDRIKAFEEYVASSK